MACWVQHIDLDYVSLEHVLRLAIPIVISRTWVLIWQMNLPLFWHVSCQSQAGRFSRSTCSYCKLPSCHCSLLSAPTQWAIMGAEVALLLELALPWTPLAVKATGAFCAKHRCQPRFPARVLLHFLSTPLPLLSGYSSWCFISVIGRGWGGGGGCQKKPKPQNLNTYSPQKTSSRRPHKRCLTHNVYPPVSSSESQG